MQNLITINEQSLSGAAEKTVNARDLHEFLGVRRDFNTWIKQRIAKYDFVEGVDFINLDSPISGNQVGHGGDRRSIDYHLTLDMAKQLSMVENTERGRQARLFFIGCERVAMSTSSGPPVNTIRQLISMVNSGKGIDDELKQESAVLGVQVLADQLKYLSLTAYGTAELVKVIFGTYGINLASLPNAPKGFENQLYNLSVDQKIQLIRAKCSVIPQ